MRQRPPTEWPALMAALAVAGLPAGLVTYVVWRRLEFSALIAAGVGIAVGVVVWATLGLTRPDDHNMIIVAALFLILALAVPWEIRLIAGLVRSLKDLYRSLNEDMGAPSANSLLASLGLIAFLCFILPIIADLPSKK